MTSKSPKLSRSKIISVRFDPELKVAAQLAAQLQNRTLSSFIEGAVQEAVCKEAPEYKELISNLETQVDNLMAWRKRKGYRY